MESVQGFAQADIAFVGNDGRHYVLVLFLSRSFVVYDTAEKIDHTR